MKIGEKIANLRMTAGKSQEQLAEMLGVSRQSVSKWEMDQALPQVDKVLQLCDLFGVSTDQLLRDKIELPGPCAGKTKYFGTDGFRGETNITLTSMHAYKVGSVILQVGWFKISHGKRIFKMAPLHHHFEMCGWKETKIVFVFTLVTALLSLVCYFGLR